MVHRIGQLAIAIASAALALAVAWFAGQNGHRIGGYSALLLCAALALVVQWIAYVPASWRQTEHFYDLVGSLTYWMVVGLALFSATSNGVVTTSQWVTAALVAVWATRLGGYLFQRVRRVGSDGRFDAIKRDPYRFLVAWTVQGLWVFLTVLAVLILLTDKTPTTGIGVWSAVGWGLWLVGFVIEVVADRQKSRFRQDEANEGRWIDEGLWSLSRHPNYFGEILLWTGLFVCGVEQYEGWQWLAACSPIFVAVLLTKGSGVPLLAARAQARWGDDPAFQAYVRRTRVLIPFRKTNRD